MSRWHPRVVHVKGLVGKVAPIQIFGGQIGTDTNFGGQSGTDRNFWCIKWHRYEFFAGYFGFRQSLFIPALLRIQSFTIGIIHPDNIDVDK